MCNTSNEKSMYDKLLIVCDKPKEGNNSYPQKECQKVFAYRNNLITELIKLDTDAFSSLANLNIYNIEDLRHIISMAYKHGYLIYQLTQL